MNKRKKNLRAEPALSEGVEETMKWREAFERNDDGVKNYFTPFVGGRSSDELDYICETANAKWEAEDSHLRIGWSMGEILPGSVRQRELPI